MTQSCAGGRATTIRLRCDPLRPGTGGLAVPRWVLRRGNGGALTAPGRPLSPGVPVHERRERAVPEDLALGTAATASLNVMPRGGRRHVCGLHFGDSHPSTRVSPYSKCPEGTCDGCAFHLLWATAEGCPRCSANHFRAIVGACQGGVQVGGRAGTAGTAGMRCHRPDLPPPPVAHTEDHVRVAGAAAVPWGAAAAPPPGPPVPQR